MTIEESERIGESLLSDLRTQGQPPRYSLKAPESMVEIAVTEDDLNLLRCYRKSFNEGCGLIGHHLFNELACRGYPEDSIDQYIAKWRIDLRKDLLVYMQNVPELVGLRGIPDSALECMIMAYTSKTEDEALVIAETIKDRGVITPQELTTALSNLEGHHSAVAKGSL